MAGSRRLLLGTVVVLLAALYLPPSASADPIPLGAPIGSTGSGAGQFNYPSAVASDGAGGDLYVTDTNNHRIDVFGADGTFLRAFGWGVDDGTAAFQVCTTASTCQAGLSGTGAGQLNLPGGVALDGAGGLYVAEFGDDRINLFGTAGPSFTHAFGWGVDDGTAAFQVCTTASTCQAGTAGAAAGQLSRSDDIAFDGAGGLYVAEQNSNRIDLFATAGPSFTHAFGWGVDDGTAAFQVCTTASGCQTGTAGAGAGQLSGPFGVAVDSGGDLYAADGNNNRIAAFGTAGPSFTGAFGWGVDDGTAAFQVCTTASLCQAGISGSGAGQINDPEDVAADCQGAAWVADSGNSRLQRFGEPGTPLCQTAASGGGEAGGGAPAPITTPITPKRKCKKGFVLKKVKGKKKCVKKKKK